ncbi:hypothetical protein GYMLUDRAFT_32660 [Collybiopsis luxurians FD-317 M1]|nr:hypothetical protein GYMLUDRAFT_32660 [Collybiopsis luxurians FD-317 M1]
MSSSGKCDGSSVAYGKIDGSAIRLMKENKSLKTKVESLTRKVNNLQTKLAAAKATLPAPAPVEQRIPSASSAASTIPSSSIPSSSSSSPPTSVSSSVAPVSRPRSNTMVGTSATSRPEHVSPPVPDRLNRVVSGPSALPRPKTPERRTVLGPVFKAMSPKKDKSKAEPSAAQNKKRRAPDDFEGYEVPPQVFTADSLPGDNERIPEHSTPKVRRVLSSIQTGFTPARHQNRPVIPMPSPKRAEPASMKVLASASTPDFTNNPFAPAPAAAPPTDGKKRSWLGKIRGASAMTQREFP